MSGTTLTNVLTILGIFLAPFFAVFAQREIEKLRDKKNRKEWIFKTLMATRSRTLSLDHVQALNLIRLEFTGKSGKPVRDAWKEYHDHLNSYPHNSKEESHRTAWGVKSDEFLVSLLASMGKSLGYKFDSLELRKGAYTPEGHNKSDFENQALRRMLLEWLDGKKSVSISLVEPPSSEG